MLCTMASPRPTPACETAQYALRLDRVSSVDDVLINAAGAGPAALASHRWWRATAKAPVFSPPPTASHLDRSV
jgi:hypothetical protein